MFFAKVATQRFFGVDCSPVSFVFLGMNNSLSATLPRPGVAAPQHLPDVLVHGVAQRVVLLNRVRRRCGGTTTWPVAVRVRLEPARGGLAGLACTSACVAVAIGGVCVCVCA